jgi:hypothetical protein
MFITSSLFSLYDSPLYYVFKSNKIKNHINSLKIKNQEKETERLLLYETPPNSTHPWL